MARSTNKSASTWKVSLSRREFGGSQTAEFAVALFVFFVMVFFPLLNLMGVAVSAGTLCLLTHQIATRCAEQHTFAGAMTVQTAEVTALQNSGWGHFLGLTTGSITPTLCIITTPITPPGPSTNTYGPLPPTPAPDGSKNIYEYGAKTVTLVKPLVRMSGAPFINQIPGLGQDVQMVFTAARAAEYINGLTSGSAVAGTSGGGYPQLDAMAGPDPVPSWPMSNGTATNGWRNPTLYYSLPSGYTLVSTDIFQIPANSYDWCFDPLFVVTNAATQNIILDTHEEGSWTSGPVGQGVDGCWAMGTWPPSIGAAFLIGPLTTDPVNDGRIFAIWDGFLSPNTLAPYNYPIGSWPGSGPGVPPADPWMPPTWSQLVAIVGTNPPLPIVAPPSGAAGAPPRMVAGQPIPNPAIPGAAGTTTYGPFCPLHWPGFVNLASSGTAAYIGGKMLMPTPANWQNFYNGPSGWSRAQAQNGIVYCLDNDNVRSDNTGSQAIRWMVVDNGS